MAQKNDKNKNGIISHGLVAENRRARYDYEIGETLEAGIVLTGTEVKSLRLGKAQIAESYASPEKGELWLINAHIPEYLQANRFNHEEKRPRSFPRRQHHRAAQAVLQRPGPRQAADRPRQGQEELRQARNRAQPRLEPRQVPHHERGRAGLTTA